MKSRAVTRLLQLATGLDLAQRTVDAAIRQRMKARACTDDDAYLADVVTDPAERHALIELLVVPESWFFRDADAFSVAIARVRRNLNQGKRPVRILSLPCASGEEPYSLAMAFTDAGIDDAAVRIEAADISRDALERARLGLYQRNAFRTRDLSFRDRHFTAEEGGYRIAQAIRDKVVFFQANLLEMDTPSAASRFDLIFCRNLMIYFDEATQSAAAAKLRALLADDGLLFSGYAETAAFCRHGFAMAPLSKAFAMKKQERPAAPGAARPAPSMSRRRPRPPVKTSAHSAPVAPETPAADQTLALLARARRLADEGKTEAAARDFRSYLEQVPDSAEAYFMLGLLSEHEHDEHAATEHLRRAVYLDPDHYDALCHLALLAERAGNTDGAEQLRKRAQRVFQRRQGERGNR